jgi:hypothetical protein
MNSFKTDLFLECSLAFNLFLPLERETLNELEQLERLIRMETFPK